MTKVERLNVKIQRAAGVDREKASRIIEMCFDCFTSELSKELTNKKRGVCSGSKTNY